MIKSTFIVTLVLDSSSDYLTDKQVREEVESHLENSSLFVVSECDIEMPD